MEKDEYLRIAQARVDRFHTHIPETDDISLLVLKAHLLCEEILFDIIKLKCDQPTVLDNVEIGFYVKVKLAESLHGRLVDTVVPMLTALNSLRNELSHKLESPRVDAKVRRFIDSVQASVVDENERPERSLSGCISYVVGFLGAVDGCLRWGTSDAPGIRLIASKVVLVD